jgi:hypothetical protein
MLSRREVLTGGIIGGVPALAAAEPAGAQTIEREEVRAIRDAIRDVGDAVRELGDATTLPSGIVSKLRDQMTIFLRGSGKFPDFCEVGTGVFYQMYDWHVKNSQELVVGRQPDGRYALQFMFTRLILRPETDASFVGVPYDSR